MVLNKFCTTWQISHACSKRILNSDKLQLTPFSSGRSETQRANWIKGLNMGTPNLAMEIANKHISMEITLQIIKIRTTKKIFFTLLHTITLMLPLLLFSILSALFKENKPWILFFSISLKIQASASIWAYHRSVARCCLGPQISYPTWNI